MDLENEAELQMAIEKLTKNKTVIIIAHRLKTIRNAQQIAIIANGGIVQRGTPRELAALPLFVSYLTMIANVGFI